MDKIGCIRRKNIKHFGKILVALEFSNLIYPKTIIAETWFDTVVYMYKERPWNKLTFILIFSLNTDWFKKLCK